MAKRVGKYTAPRLAAVNGRLGSGKAAQLPNPADVEGMDEAHLGPFGRRLVKVNEAFKRAVGRALPENPTRGVA